jgi:FkbM family methyltransferase
MSSIFGKLFGKKSKRKYYSQYSQDRWLYKNLFSEKRNGTFVEIGADDGVDKSNTLFFEKNLSWGGICVEPSPKRFKLLSENRECICENYAIAESEGEVEFMDISGYGKGLSGIVDRYNPEHKDRIEEEINHPDNQGYEIIQVSTMPMSSLLEKNDISHVDFCTIDTEGSELQVLKSIDFERCQFDVLLVENNYEENSVEKFLGNIGFIFEIKVGIDDVYINKKFIR